MIELLIVVAIIVLLIGILVPTLSGARNSARKAATRSLMQSVSTGVSQFRADKGRMPGHFTQEQLGQRANAEGRRGLTSMENALIELAGGNLPSDAPTPSGEGSVIKLVCTAIDQNPAVFVDTSLIGGRNGPGYLNLPGDVLRVAQGQWNGGTASNPTPSGGMDRMPDIIDAFGQPLLLWVRNPAAAKGSRFVLETAPDDRGPPGAAKAQFYWATNAGMLRAEALGNQQKRNQGLGSVLGRPTTTAALNTVEQRLESMVALLGHPTLPQTDSVEPFGAPSAPLGDAVIHSAGADGIYLSSRDGQFKRAAYRMPSDPGEAAVSREIGQFDDLVTPAG